MVVTHRLRTTGLSNFIGQGPKIALGIYNKMFTSEVAGHSYVPDTASSELATQFQWDNTVSLHYYEGKALHLRMSRGMNETQIQSPVSSPLKASMDLSFEMT